MKPTIYFDERLHKYTDDRGNTYSSVTTVISNYYEKFEEDKIALACERIGRNPNHPKYNKYKGKTAAEIKASWKDTSVTALINGSKKHDYLEDIIKRSTGYRTMEGTDFILDRLFTIDDIINDQYGEIDISWFVSTGIAFRYPDIYAAVTTLHSNGFKFYSEIGVYNVDILISGKIDLLAVKDKSFIIVDWKTNKADIKFESGYFEKDMEGNLTDSFIYTNKYLKYPLHFLADSTGNHYNLQVSGYAWLLEQFGFTNLGNIIYQIREKDGIVETVDRITLYDYRKYSSLMFEHHFQNRKLKPDLLLFK